MDHLCQFCKFHPYVCVFYPGQKNWSYSPVLVKTPSTVVIDSTKCAVDHELVQYYRLSASSGLPVFMRSRWRGYCCTKRRSCRSIQGGRWWYSSTWFKCTYVCVFFPGQRHWLYQSGQSALSFPSAPSTANLFSTADLLSLHDDRSSCDPYGRAFTVPSRGVTAAYAEVDDDLFPHNLSVRLCLLSSTKTLIMFLSPLSTYHRCCRAYQVRRRLRICQALLVLRLLGNPGPRVFPMKAQVACLPQRPLKRTSLIILWIIPVYDSPQFSIKYWLYFFVSVPICASVRVTDSKCDFGHRLVQQR